MIGDSKMLQGIDQKRAEKNELSTILEREINSQRKGSYEQIGSHEGRSVNKKNANNISNIKGRENTGSNGNSSGKNTGKKDQSATHSSE